MRGVWNQFHGIVHIRDLIRERLTKFESEPTEDNLLALQVELDGLVGTCANITREVRKHHDVYMDTPTRHDVSGFGQPAGTDVVNGPTPRQMAEKPHLYGGVDATGFSRPFTPLSGPAWGKVYTTIRNVLTGCQLTQEEGRILQDFVASRTREPQTATHPDDDTNRLAHER